jgi:CRP-like cAMP-binding protein
MRVYYTDDNGKEFTTAFRFENQPVFPVDSFTQQTPSPTNAVTLEPTELIWTSHSEFFDFLQTFPNYQKALLKMLSESLPLQSEQTKLLNISSSAERYKMFCKLRPDVIQRVPLKYISSYLGMSLETLSRVRAGKL